MPLPPRFGVIFGLCALLIAPSVAVSAQSVEGLNDRLGRLEQDLRVLTNAIYADSPPPAEVLERLRSPGPAAPGEESVLARLTVRMTDLERQVRRLTGLVEQSDFHLTRINNRIDKLIGDMDDRLAALEQGAVVARAGSTDSAAPTAPGDPGDGAVVTEPGAEAQSAPTVQPLGRLIIRETEADKNEGAVSTAALPVTAEPEAARAGEPVPEERYQSAFNLLRRQQFDRAAEALRQFILDYPDDTLTGNAQYWLGETYYARGMYNEAVTEFKVGVQTYPDSNKAPDNVLKLGMALGNLGQTRDACITFRYLLDTFPDAAAAVKRRANLERDRQNCANL